MLGEKMKALEIRGRIETIQTLALLRLAWRLRRVLKTCWYLDSREKPPVKNNEKNVHRVVVVVIIIIIIMMMKFSERLTLMSSFCLEGNLVKYTSCSPNQTTSWNQTYKFISYSAYLSLLAQYLSSIYFFCFSSLKT